MSHLITLRRSETPSEATVESLQDSPTIGRGTSGRHSDRPSSSSSSSSSSTSTTTTTTTTITTPQKTTVPTLSLPFTGIAKSQRRAAPSPLHISTARSSPSVSPKSASFPSPAVDCLAPSPLPSPSASTSALAATTTQPLTQTHRLSRALHSDLESTSFLEISPPTTPVTSDPRPNSPPLFPNESPSLLSLVARTKPVGPATKSLDNMASKPSIAKVDAVRGPARTSSIDSAVSTISSRAPSQQSSPDDIANLIRTAGSPEAVIQHLLKEKQSQSQQNAQLWRLVDKQRAMILGLNKDLDRAMKDKDKYRKKLKEVIAIHDDYAKPDITSRTGSLATIDTKISDTEHSEAPRSPSNFESDASKQSPINVTPASNPITTPADRTAEERLANIREILNPMHTMPTPTANALDHFDHKERDQIRHETRNANNAAHELQLPIGPPPSRSPPSEPSRAPQLNPPTVSIIEATPIVDQGISQFPPPSAPPLRKPPPAPLQLKQEPGISNSPTIDEENDSESDYDSLLEVDEPPTNNARGRRRTREDDDREREIIAQREAEVRSLSRKSKKGSQKGMPKSDDTQNMGLGVPISARPEVTQLSTMRDNAPASLAGMLSGNGPQKKLHPALMSPGLPSSPRPMAFPQPLSPRNMNSAAIPLSPRAPRQPLPLPPNTPKFQSVALPPPNVAPKSHPIKQIQELDPPQELEQPERTEIFRGFITEEYPDLLLPPNALPSVAVKVASSRMKPSRASLLALTQLEEDPVFTLAILSRSEGGELWRVEKDTSSLAKLDQRMKQCSAFTTKTPDRSLFSGHSPAKLDARRATLDNYLDELLNTALDLPTAVELCKYLSTSVLPPNSDHTSGPSDEAGETDILRKGPGGRPLKHGYLTKRGKNFGGWKTRFFVLDSSNLKYYETPGGAHLGTIKLLNAQIGKQAPQTHDSSTAGGSNGDESDNQYRHAFLVLEPKKKDTNSYVKHILCAESDQERDQWVDTLFRYIENLNSNEDKAASKAGAQGNNNQCPVNTVHAKKKGHGHGHGHGKLYEQQSESQDALVGMSYDAAKQGDIPDGAPPQRRGTASPEPLEKGVPSSYTISAPKDPYIISDSAAWGSKTNLLPPGPSVEEKKQRKRSFFGFGPKARSSSDDQDPLSNSSGGSTPQPQADRGSVRQVFGAPLAEAVRYCGPIDSNVPIPAVVYRCIQYLDVKNAVEEEGIFRLSGSNVLIKQLRERFNQEGDINLLTDDTYYDIHAVASLLKLYLRELPTTILTRELHNQFITVTEIANHREKIEALSELVQRLPLANETLLKYLISFLIKVINHADMNKMTVRNVGIVFSPTLHIPAPVFALLLQNYRGIFGIEPEEYELPSPVSESDSRPPSELPPRRPSTAGPTESPHRQRLVEQTQQRSTPTPPPTAPGLGIRATGTPPPRQAHEVQYFAQQGLNPRPNSRPGYEGGFPAPGNYDITAAAPPNSKQPAYDRPHYGYGPSYEQGYSSDPNGMLDASFGNKSKKRESAMFMGNMIQHQTSNSRLKEETRL
ncbi:hypothetical protein F4861DRAFT_254934 [Xylaria intraflava]|nr:hypothetical protein F4861DRAFT_254934 [Xylaria intraflava]